MIQEKRRCSHSTRRCKNSAKNPPVSVKRKKTVTEQKVESPTPSAGEPSVTRKKKVEKEEEAMHASPTHSTDYREDEQ